MNCFDVGMKTRLSGAPVLVGSTAQSLKMWSPVIACTIVVGAQSTA